MTPGRIRSLVFFILLFAVAALALDASYTQSLGSGGARQKQQMPQAQQGKMQQDMHQKSQVLASKESICVNTCRTKACTVTK